MKILLFGGSGLVGSGVAPILKKHFSLTTPTHKEVDITQLEDVGNYIQETRPDWIISAVGMANVDEAQKNPKQAYLLNAQTARTIKSCAKNIPFCYLSTDAVFDGTKNRPYAETDTPHPVNTYGQTKLEGERYARLVVRIIMPYCTYFAKKKDLARLTLTALQKGEHFTGIIDQIINPLFMGDLALALTTLISEGASGIYHLGATDFVTNHEFAKKIARAFNLDDTLVDSITFKEFMKEKTTHRSQFCALDTQKFQNEFGPGILHTVDEGLALFKTQVALSSPTHTSTDTLEATA